MADVLNHKFLIRAVQPDLPEPQAYLPWLEGMHENGYFTNFGPLHEEMVRQMLVEFGADGEDCIGCCNATAGLSAALIAGGATKRVLVPAFTFPATMSAVIAAGLEPVVMDVDRNSWAIAPDRLETALAETGADAVILVAPFGFRYDFSAQIDACRRHGASVIIDCAAGMGVPRSNVCDGPDVFEIFSLHATKPFGIGEGGLIYCHASQGDAVRSALNFALPTFTSDTGPSWGFNGKLSELHAAVALAQLARYRDMIEQRQRFAQLYFDALDTLPAIVTAPRDTVAPWQIFPALLPTEQAADEFVDSAANAGIEIRRYYRPSLSQWPGILTAGDCPVSEDLASRMVALPVRRAAQGADARPIIDRVTNLLRQVLEQAAYQ